MKRFKLLFVVFALFLASVSISYASSYTVTTDLTIRAIINTVEKGAIDAVWSKGGEETTSSGDKVIWGFFYASSSDVTWGSENNPDLYVKIWFDHGGRIDVNFFHVSVPDIDVYSDYSGSSTSNQQSTTTMENRYYRHEYNSNTAACSDVSGAWSWSQTVDATACGEGIYTETGINTITQNGCNLVGDDGSYGSINGNTATMTKTWYEEGYTITGIYTMIYSGNSVTWTGALTASSPFGGTCTGSSTGSGSK
ncbi:MAG: hypothetical protein K8S13_23120 [Desulfobacula sp.]|uniref:hypothetical protein n=1 Tax=Desulfobacula sp. TaxID=2593537 RepID=UPI0025C54420|nr:hypothetical protein [Desulfobacula sp.]MCD4722721.1 hypothetical protein [Desulfobacula sp.]